MQPIEIFRHLKSVVADLERLQEIDRDPSIFTIKEGRERLASALERCIGLAELLRRDALQENIH